MASPLDLRDAVQRISRLSGQKQSLKRHLPSLRKFLSSGKMTAYIIFPNVNGDRLAIPARYWTNLEPSKFYTILRNDDKDDRPGTYYLDALSACSIYAASILTDPDMRKTFIAAVEMAAQKYEVMVDASQVDEALGLDRSPVRSEDAHRSSQGRGRPRNEAWSEVLSEVAILIAEGIRSGKSRDSFNQEALAQVALERLSVGDTKKALPNRKTVAKFVGNILSRIDWSQSG